MGVDHEHLRKHGEGVLVKHHKHNTNDVYRQRHICIYVYGRMCKYNEHLRKHGEDLTLISVQA